MIVALHQSRYLVRRACQPLIASHACSLRPCHSHSPQVAGMRIWSALKSPFFAFRERFTVTRCSPRAGVPFSLYRESFCTTSRWPICRTRRWLPACTVGPRLVLGETRLLQQFSTVSHSKLHAHFYLPKLMLYSESRRLGSLG